MIDELLIGERFRALAPELSERGRRIWAASEARGARPWWDRGDVEGKRASCEVYARIAVIQADANVRFRCGLQGPA